MEQNNVTGYSHHRPTSTDRFIGVFSPPSTGATISPISAAASIDELNEVDVFYSNDFSEPPKTSPSSVSNHRHRHSFVKPGKFGILAALPEDHRSSDAIIRQPSLPSSPATAAGFARNIPSIPKPHSSSEMKQYAQSMPIRRFQQSAPVKIPLMRRKPSNHGAHDAVDVGDDDGIEDEEVLPPHEIVARGSMRDQKTTFSVLEGVGRTLKGRDLRRVRNAVWRQTGFLD